MENPYRGEVSLVVDGVPRVARLTLGALVELEARLSVETLPDLVKRFEKGRYGSADVLALVVAGLRGGGWSGDLRDLANAEIEGGPLRAAQVAAQLLARAFALPT